MALHFGEVLEAADHLSHDEQEELIGILHRRLIQVLATVSWLRSKNLARNLQKAVACRLPRVN